jgi:uncharacterized protein YndB with AHSA1/START domain
MNALTTLRLLLATAGLLTLAGGAHAQGSDPIVAEGVVAAPVEAAWTAWATSEGLRSWLAPHADIDLRVGGLMRTNYSQDGTLDGAGAIHNEIMSFEPGRMLSIRVVKFPERFPFPDAVRSMWTVISFDPDGSSRTQVRIAGLGFQPDEQSQQMRAFFERGNLQTLQQLQRRFATPPAAMTTND